jgi:hypothetical protein
MCHVLHPQKGYLAPHLKNYWYRVNTENPNYMFMFREKYAEQNHRE